MVSYNSDSREMFMTSSDITQVALAFDVYVVGELEYAFYDPEPTDANRWQQKEMITTQIEPFKVIVGEPWWMVFNTAPLADFLPY